MVQLIDSDILTREVLDWKGTHLFHFPASSCSQKTRIFLNLKGIDWESHIIDLGNGENYTPWYLGINPRGLVPTLILDGQVHIESNDIIQLLDRLYPDNPLIPKGRENEVADLLHHEDDLHLDVRTISFRFTQPRGRTPRSEETLKNYREGGSGTVQGKKDPNKERELEFWGTAADDGLTNDAVKISAHKFKAALDELDDILSSEPYLTGDALSVLDVAWFVYVNRLWRCSYPLKRLHPNVDAWFWPLRERPQFASEIGVPPDVQKAVEDHHALQAAEGRTLEQVAEL